MTNHTSHFVCLLDLNILTTSEQYWITVYNEISQEWVEPSVPVTMSLVNELPPQYSTLAAPCKLKLETSGPLGLKYPDKMGIYHLLTNTTYYGSPAWKKNDETYLKKDEEGTWVVSKVNLTQNIFSKYFLRQT